MLRLLIDEDMPRSLKPTLADDGHEVTDVRDVGLRGCTDEKIYEYAQQQHLGIVTGDLGFASIIRFPLGRHKGIIVAHFPNETPTQKLICAVSEALKSLSNEQIAGKIIVIEPSRIRTRAQH